MNYIKIKNFKCFHEIDIPLNKLTVLAGANGNGKMEDSTTTSRMD
jgi:predicted ATPase